MRLGVFGGSFDPVHFGHLLLAEACREQASLDRILFVPAAIPPHKRTQQRAPDQQRVEMLKLAIGGHEPFDVSTVEIDRGGVSYTVETLAAIQEQSPDAQLFFLMGGDSLQDLPTWREPKTICDLSIPLVVRRSGALEPDYGALSSIVDQCRLDEIRRHQVEMPIIELSSTEIRRRVAEGASIRFQLPRAVEQYIAANQLYQASG